MERSAISKNHEKTVQKATGTARKNCTCTKGLILLNILLNDLSPCHDGLSVIVPLSALLFEERALAFPKYTMQSMR